MLHTTSRLIDLVGERCPYYTKIKEVVGKSSRSPDTLVPLTVVLDTVGLYAALWTLRCVLQDEKVESDKVARLFSCDCAERVLPLFERVFPDDKRPRRAIETVRQSAGKPVSLELDKSRKAAREEAWDAAWAVSWGDSTEDFEIAAWAAYETTAPHAVLAVMEVASEAAKAVVLNAGEAAWDAETQAQVEILRRYLNTSDSPTPGA